MYVPKHKSHLMWALPALAAVTAMSSFAVALEPSL
jgi:hypothetical protein